MSINQWFTVEHNSEATFVRILTTDIGGRWITGEIGVLVVNTYPEKYDYMVLLAPSYDVPTAAQVRFAEESPFARLFDERTFYFYSCDIAYLRGPGYGEIEPGWSPVVHYERCSEHQILSAIIDLDLKVGL